MQVAPHSFFLLLTISRLVRSSRLLLMQESSRGTTGCGTASGDLTAPVAWRGAMALGEGELQQEDQRLRGFGCSRSLKGRRQRRCTVEVGEEPSLPSFKAGRKGVVSEMSPLMRRFKNAHYSTHYAQSPCRFTLPTARAPRAHDLCIFT
jgi:hypothetical protein